MHETDGSGATTVVYTHEPSQFGPLISENRGGTTFTHHYDAMIGSTTMLTNDGGTVTDTFAYDAWGNSIARTGTTPTPYQWTGRWGYQLDVVATAYYIRARTYQPIIGRWASTGRLFLISEAYAYLAFDNRPTIAIDPSGNAACNAKCVRPQMGWGIKYAGPRGLSLTTDLRGASPPLKSYMTSIGKLGDASDEDSWWERGSTPSDSRTHDGCCCCCTGINWVQVVRATLKGTPASIKWYNDAEGSLTSGVYYIDGGIPYPGGTAINPCNAVAPILIPPKWYSFLDQPGWASIYAFFAKGGTQYLAEFETCLACMSGPEGYLESEALEPFLVTYCCFSWSVKAFIQGNKYKVSRSLGANSGLWSLDSEKNPNTADAHILANSPTCQAPSQFFLSGVRSGNVNSPPT